MNVKKWVKSIQIAGYNGARTVLMFINKIAKMKLAELVTQKIDVTMYT